MVHSGVPRLREGRRGMPEDLRRTVFRILMRYNDIQTAAMAFTPSILRIPGTVLVNLDSTIPLR